MEATKNDQLVAPVGDSAAAIGSARSSASDSASPDREQHNSKLDKVADFHSVPISDALDGRTAGSASKATHIQALGRIGLGEGGDGVVLPEGGNSLDNDDPGWKSADSVQGLASAPPQPASRAKGGGGGGGGGGGRRLTFADETGGTLAEVSYSNRTHYSKQAGPSALGGSGRACCVIS